MNEIMIGKKKVSKKNSPYIIAEVGINHNGEIEKAYKMIEIAKNVGADCVKFQTFKAGEFISDPNQMYTYQSQGREVTESVLEMFKRYEFPDEKWFQIKKRCDNIGITFLSTPQNSSDLDLLLRVGISAIKVGSDDFNNLPLLKEFTKTKLPLLLSCGMADAEEVNQTMRAVRYKDGYPVVLLVCTSLYPTYAKDVNILRLKTLSEMFPELILGFSDHTQGSIAAILAVGLGAVVFEKHFTLDNNLPGPDHWFSENPNSLKQWIESIKTASIMMGSSKVQPTPQEINMRANARRSVVATQNIKVGDVISLENCALLKPGTGIPPAQFKDILGRKAIKDIKSHTLLRWEDLK